MEGIDKRDFEKSVACEFAYSLQKRKRLCDVYLAECLCGSLGAFEQIVDRRDHCLNSSVERDICLHLSSRRLG